MLIEFSVANFRSIRERQTLSMVAAPRLRKGDNVFIPDVQGEKLPPLLKVVAIYGPNASGKSNLIKALNIVERFASLKPGAEKELLPVSPFRFDDALAKEPSEFEVHFVYERRRYMFELSATPDRITTERLTTFPNGKSELLYSRNYSGSSYDYVFGRFLEGDSALHETWKNITGSQVLFLSQAVANSNDDLKQLRKPWTWLAHGGMTMKSSMISWIKPAQSLIAEIPEFGSRVSKLLEDVDLPIVAIKSRLASSAESPLTEIDSEAERDRIRKSLFDPKTKFKTVLTHTTKLGSADFDLSEESDGTQNLIGFSLPWLLMGMETEDPKCILIVDEMDSSLHPKIVEMLVGKFLKSEKVSQLIFTTHDTHLMDSKLLRRDQYWITDRDVNGATQLRSIHDFEGREGEDIEKRYYEGRYRGLPLTRKF